MKILWESGGEREQKRGAAELTQKGKEDRKELIINEKFYKLQKP